MIINNEAVASICIYQIIHNASEFGVYKIVLVFQLELFGFNWCLLQRLRPPVGMKKDIL